MAWKSLHGARTPRATAVICEELGLFTEPLFAAPDLGGFIDVKANLGGVVVSG